MVFHPKKTPEVEARMLAVMNDEEKEQYHKMQQVRVATMKACIFAIIVRLPWVLPRRFLIAHDPHFFPIGGSKWSRQRVSSVVR